MGSPSLPIASLSWEPQVTALPLEEMMSEGSISESETERDTEKAPLAFALPRPPKIHAIDQSVLNGMYQHLS